MVVQIMEVVEIFPANAGSTEICVLVIGCVHNVVGTTTLHVQIATNVTLPDQSQQDRQDLVIKVAKVLASSRSCGQETGCVHHARGITIPRVWNASSAKLQGQKIQLSRITILLIKMDKLKAPMDTTCGLEIGYVHHVKDTIILRAWNVSNVELGDLVRVQLLIMEVHHKLKDDKESL